MRVEAIIAEIYKQKCALETQNKRPSIVIMSLSMSKILHVYHLLLGSIKNTEVDYLGQDSVWGLEIMIDNNSINKVEVR